ncbi:hypothetical protein C3E97_028380 [Pseudomonas sp. MWU12-2115]|nr:hypothetical protein C3E97_028380 [Pseudomonas sp. MWU12-2115]
METKPRGRAPRGSTSTRVVYVGTDGYAHLLAAAIAISSEVGKQITPAKLARHLAFNITDETKARLIKEMQNTNDE